MKKSPTSNHGRWKRFFFKVTFSSKIAKCSYLFLLFILCVPTGISAQPDRCPDIDCPDACGIETNPGFKVACSFFEIDLGPEIATVELTAPASISCNDDFINVCATMEFGGFGCDDVDALGGGSGTIGGLIGPVCTLIDGIDISLPLGIGTITIIPNFFPEVDICGDSKQLTCDDPISLLIIGLLQLAVSDIGGHRFIADTDGDGAFDHNMSIGMGPFLNGCYNIPNNLDGPGCITIRGINSFPISPADNCGMVQPEISLLELLSPLVNAIPIAGPIIIAVLETAMCDANLAFSASQDLTIEVSNAVPPVWVNCPDRPYVFADDGSCTDPVNWSIPIAIDDCFGLPLLFQGVGAVDGEQGIWQTAGPTVGTDLGVGTHTVTYTAIGCDETAECTFDIQVQDNNPLLVCPSDMTVGTDVDVCSRIIKGLVPISGQSCVSMITYGVTGATTVPAGTDYIDLQNGVTFLPGTSTVTYIMMVDLDNNGSVADVVGGIPETQECSFDITVEDNQKPFVPCMDIVVQLDATGDIVVFASEELATASPDVGGLFFIDGGSTDNCTPRDQLIIRIDDVESLTFDCDDVGPNVATLSVFDLNYNADGTLVSPDQATGTGGRNVRSCLAEISVLNYFEDYSVELDIPELCLEDGIQEIHFANYLTIRTRDGQLLSHGDVLTNPDLEGVFTVANGGFLNGGNLGNITPDGVFNPAGSMATGNLVIDYTLSLANNSSCDIKGQDVFELRQPQNVSPAICQCLNDDNYREINLGDFLGEPDTDSPGNFFPNGQGPYTIQYTGGVLTDGTGNIIDPNQNGTVIYDYAYIPGTTVDHFGVYWGSGNILDDDNTTTDLTDNPVVQTLLAPQDLTGTMGVFNLGSIIPVDTGSDGIVGTNDDVQLDGNWSFTIVDSRGCEIFRSGSCTPLLTQIEGPSGPVCITDPVLTFFDIRTNNNLTTANPLPTTLGIPTCETVAGGAAHDITWELATLTAAGNTTIDLGTIAGGILPAGYVDPIADNTPTSILTILENGLVEVNPRNLIGVQNGGDFVLRMYIDRHACHDPDDVGGVNLECNEVFEIAFTVFPEFDPYFVTPNLPICVDLTDDLTTDDGDAFNPADNESLITLCLNDYANIISVFDNVETIFDASGQIIEENVYITWSGPGVVDLNDGIIRDNDGNNTTTDGPGRVNGAGNSSTGCATFDPTIAGVGTHTITVEVGYDNCRRTFSQTIVVKPIDSAELIDNYAVCSSHAGQINLSILYDNALFGGQFTLINAYGYGQNGMDNIGLNDGTYVLDDVSLLGDINQNGIPDVYINGNILQYESDTQQPLSAADTPIEVCVAYGVGCDFSLLGADYLAATGDEYINVEVVSTLSAATPPPPAGNYFVVANPTGTAPIFRDLDTDGFVSVEEIIIQFTAVNPISATYNAATQVADLALILAAMNVQQPCFSYDIACFTINDGHEANLDLPSEIYCVRGQDTLIQLYRHTSIEDVNLADLIVEEHNGNLDPGEIQFLLGAVNGLTYLSPTTSPMGFAPGTPGVPSVFTIDSDADGVYTAGVDLDLTNIISTANCDADRKFGPINPVAPASEFCPMIDLGILHSICEPVNVRIRMQYNDSECIKVAEDNILKLYEIPTMSEWGLLIFALLLFNMGLVFFFRQQLVVAGATNFSMRAVPFDKEGFAKYFGGILFLLALIFIISIVGFGYQLMPFDMPGSIITAMLLAYMIQLTKKEQGTKDT